MTMNRPPSKRRVVRGVVTSDRGAKTITVQVSRRFRHPKYGKMIGYERKVRAHDEADEAHVGDTVEVVECRPMSRTKRWRLVRILERNPEAAAVSAVATEVGAPQRPPQEASPAGGEAAS